MEAEVYVPGRRKDESFTSTLSSSAILFLVQYCAPLQVKLSFVEDEVTDEGIELPLESLKHFEHRFCHTKSLPLLIRNCQLPVVADPEMTMVRSGLCSVFRHIVKLADAARPEENFKDLLGFRQGSLRMCAEVSGWTKLCEVELNESLTIMINRLRSSQLSETVELPEDLMKLEAHFLKPPRIHNDDKLRRAVLKEVKEEFQDENKRSQILNQCSQHQDGFTLMKEKKYPHGNRRFKLSKPSSKDTEKLDKSQQERGDNCIEDLVKGIESLTYIDVTMEHLYSEGLEMTVADLILFVYLYHVLESLKFDTCQLSKKIPRIVKWLQHMVQVEKIHNMSDTCFNVRKLKECLVKKDSIASCHVNFTIPNMEEVTDDEMELSRRCRSKHKAYKPDISIALKKIQTHSISPKTGSHLRGSNVQVDWDSLPPSVHPREGNVPAKRTERKCQQLENLVTAVEVLARPGDVIVDFCSGGGHLGIVIAHLLPSCKVYLIENKEESLMKAKYRIDALKLENVVLYQCNLDYFHGRFDIGVCLHACGSATDMVLEQCLNNNSAFVICPCCYGSIQKTHLLSYPRSKLFLDADISYKDFLTLGHAADQTEFNIALEEQGRHCSNLVDTDRAELAREQGYNVTLCSLHPRTCTPKNNLLIGTPHNRENGVS